MGDSGLVLSAFGFLIISAYLLGISGITGQSISVPTAPCHASAQCPLSFTTAVLQCIISLFGTCSETQSNSFFQAVSDAINYAVQAVGFLFQMLTFQLPNVPAWFTAIIYLPPGSVLAYVAIKMFRGTGG